LFVGANSQVIITIPGLPNGLVKPDMLWNIIVVNQGQAFDGIIQLVLKDKNNNQIVNINSTLISFPKGAKTIFPNSVVPVRYTYNQLSSDQWIKVGKYFICYTISKIASTPNPTFETQTVFEINQNSEVIANECTELNIEPISPPILNIPADKGNIYETKPVFLWQAPTPFQSFSNLKYEIKLVELQKGQSLNLAIQNNTPIYYNNSIYSTALILPSSLKDLEVNHSYAWQVTAYDQNSYSIKSECWQFNIAKDSVMDIIDKSPYMHMSSQTATIGTMHQGYIKIYLDNTANDSIANICLREEAANASCIVSTNIHLQAGDNYIVQELANKVRLSEKKIYQLVWLDSKNRKYILRFQPKYYK
jgi:hypothetical protein